MQLGTLGGGNHFLEFQSDEEGRLWVMVHSGSRAMGQAIYRHHVTNARQVNSGLKCLDAKQPSGRQYLADVQWARTYASENRLAMLTAVEQYLEDEFGITANWESLIHADHNHVQQEEHHGKSYWVHRKGAQSARKGEPGIIPGSMGTASFHTIGRGEESSLYSCSHGAGRRLSRGEARKQVSAKKFARQVGSLWYDHRRTKKLCDEAPFAYKNIHQVMRAQRDLTRIVRELQPILNYKGV